MKNTKKAVASAIALAIASVGLVSCSGQLQDGTVAGSSESPSAQEQDKDRGTSDHLGEQLTPSSATPERGFSLTPKDKLKKDTKSVHIYVDPACPDCARYEQENGEKWAQQAEAGEINLIYVPVPFLNEHTVDNYSNRASSAFITLAEKDPEVALKFLSKIYSEEDFPGAGPSHKVTTTQQLADWAKEVGASDELADNIMENHYYDWVSQSADFAEKDKVLFPSGGVGTPTVVDGGKYSEGKLVEGSGYELLDLR